MNGDQFVYVTYIRTTADKLWEALINPEFTRKYWFGCWQDSAWTAGSSWKLTLPDGRIAALHGREPLAQVVHFPGHHDGRQACELGHHLGQCLRILIGRLLCCVLSNCICSRPDLFAGTTPWK